MLVSRHRIGRYRPEVVHQGPDPAAVAVCRELLAESGAECVILHGSRGWGGWDEQPDLNVIVIHHAVGDEVERDRLRGEAVRVKERLYRDSSDYKADLESGPDIVTPEDYAAQRRTLNHTMAHAARAGTIFPKEPGVEGRYRHDGDTSNEWELVTRERLRLAASRNRDLAVLREMHRGLEEQRGGRYSGVDAQMAGRTAHMLLWHSGAALLSILGVIYPMRSTVEMARLVDERDGGWSHRFQSDLVRIEQYAECWCELVVTEPLTNLPELWENLEADREALWRRILDLSGYDLNDGGTTRRGIAASGGCR